MDNRTETTVQQCVFYASLMIQTGQEKLIINAVFFYLGYFVFRYLTKCACMIPLTKLVAISCGTTSCILKVKVTVLCLLDSSWHSTTPPPLPKESTVSLGPRSLTVLRRFVPGLLERFSGSVSVVSDEASGHSLPDNTVWFPC